MEERKLISGLTYRGNGFFRYEDATSPRMSDLDVAKRVGKSLGKRVRHISTSPYLGMNVHVLQYEHLYQKDLERETQRLSND